MPELRPFWGQEDEEHDSHYSHRDPQRGETRRISRALVVLGEESLVLIHLVDPIPRSEDVFRPALANGQVGENPRPRPASRAATMAWARSVRCSLVKAFEM